MKRRILFTRHYEILDAFIRSVGEENHVFVLGDDRYEPPKVSGSEVIMVRYGLLWLVSIFNKLHLDTALPIYIKDFSKITNSVEPQIIFSFDFFRFYFWQSIDYVKQHPETKLFLWSETRRLPRNFLSRLIMRLFLWKLKRSARHLEKILVWTEEGRDFFNKILPTVPTVLVPAPVDTELFYPDHKKTFMTNGVFRILMNARYIPLKRHSDMLNALVVLKNMGIDCKLSLVGNGGYLEGLIKTQVADLDLTGEVEFLPAGSIRDMRKYYISNDVVVLPSSSEAIGMVVPEAMACGIPTITSDAVGANLYVDRGSTGLVFKAMDVSDLASCLRRMANPSILKKFGENAHKRVEEKFTFAAVQATFRNVVNEKRSV